MPLRALRRLRRVGLAGLAFRVEALLLLRHARRELTRRPFKDLQAELAARAARTRDATLEPRPRSPAEPAAPAASGAEPLPSSDRAAVAAVEVGNAVASAARFVPGARCVAQSLAAQAMLVRRGVPSTIQFGFRRKDDGAVEGHAWLEATGRIVAGDGDLRGFTRTAVFEA